MSGNGRLVRVDQPQVGHISANGPMALATPVSSVAAQPGGALFLSSGGLTKLEHAAIELMKHGGRQPKESVTMAKEVLDECAAVQAAEQAKAQQSGNIQE